MSVAKLLTDVRAGGRPRQRARAAVVVLVAAVVFAARIGEPSWAPRGLDRSATGAPRGDEAPPRYLFDEQYTAFAAHRLLAGDPALWLPSARRFDYLAGGAADLGPASRAEWSHPPGGPEAIAPFIAAFGFAAIPARLAALAFAVVALVATALLAGRRAAPWACALLACDGVFFVFARTAMPHMTLAAAIAAGAALLHRALRHPGPSSSNVARARRRPVASGSPRRRAIGCAAAAGVAFGLAMSVRWSAAPIVLTVFGAAAVSREGARGRWRAPCAVACAAACATYLAAFAPFFAAGYGLGDLARLHRAMLWFHAHLPRDFGHELPWYAWPFALRPVQFGARAAGGGSAVVWALGNPFVWWAIVPVLAWGAWRARRRRIAHLLPVAVLAGAWLPWAFVDRFALPYYLLPALPFTAVALARALHTARLRSARRWYVGAAMAMFVVTYPVLASVPIARGTEDVYRAIVRLPPLR